MDNDILDDSYLLNKSSPTDVNRVDPDTQARLELLLNAAGKYYTYNNS